MMLSKSFNNFKYKKAFIRRSANLKPKKKILILKHSAVITLDTGKITDHQIESIRKNIKWISKQKSSIFFKNVNWSTVTRKAQHSRMGKGKASMISLCWLSKPGTIICEFVENLNQMALINKKIKSRYPIDSALIQKWTVTERV